MDSENQENQENQVNEEIKEVETKPKMTKQEYNKLYYTKKKEDILKKVLQVCHCEICGCTVSKQHKKRHQLTNICKKRALQKIE